MIGAPTASFQGFNLKTIKDHSVDLGDTPDISRAASWARSQIPRDEGFLMDKHSTTHRKIKITDCVYDIAGAKVIAGLPPEERFLVHVQRAFPPRVQADIDAARKFVEDIFTLPGVETAPRASDYDFEKVPLW